VTILLFAVGLIALYIELSAPGISVGGLIAGLCFALFFWSRFLGGTSGWLEVVLFLLGVLFLLIELFVLPGFGFAGITGLLLILAAIVMASQGFTVPHSGMELRALMRTLLILAGSGCAGVLGIVVLSRYFGAIPVLGRLALQPASAGPLEFGQADGAAATALPAATLYGVQVGDYGLADSPLRPAGRARFEDNYVDVVADGFVDRGRPVRVIRISGNRIVVREADHA
jgi:membrane-bound serine protease (ClpP class)